MTLIHGAARGADRIAWDYAYLHNWTVRHYNADWNKYGDNAGPIRNKKMLECEKDGLELVIAFRRNGISSGTDHMCRIAKEAGIETTVINELS
jgi:hypothetical protein